MFNPELLKPEIQEFIHRHRNTDPVQLLLKPTPFPGVSMQELAEQIRGKQKCKQKLPAWYRTPGIYYPPPLALEQCSSSATGAYKATLCRGDTLADLTGGAGVDTWFFSKQYRNVFHIERSEALSRIAAHNLSLLGATNVRFLTGDGLDLLSELPPLDCIYLDPSRRSRENKKVVLPEDYEPHFIPHLPMLRSRASRVLVKTSPLIDLKFGLKAFPGVRAVHVVSVRNECKELLWLFEPGPESDVQVTCVNLHSGEASAHANPPFVFRITDEDNAGPASLSSPLKFLYEPNASILKAGAFKTVASRFGLGKLHVNSHLYTSNEHVNDFPGRVFHIIDTLTAREFGHRFKNKQVHVTTRNFPERAPALLKKYAITEGGADFAFFTTTLNNKRVVLLCQKAPDLPAGPPKS